MFKRVVRGSIFGFVFGGSEGDKDWGCIIIVFGVGWVLSLGRKVYGFLIFLLEVICRFRLGFRGSCYFRVCFYLIELIVFTEFIGFFDFGVFRYIWKT